jgi:adenylate cyclase
MTQLTIVFADLTGSTSVFEAIGNTKATVAITRVTQWMGKVCDAHQGRVVKFLGDGVLMAFSDSTKAVSCMIETQRLHSQRMASWPAEVRMPIKVGIASGEVVEQQGDCFGDAVNVAARLSDLAGAEQILASDAVVNALPSGPKYRHRSMGPIEIRGRQEACVVFRLEWQEDANTAFMTVPASLDFMPTVQPNKTHQFMELSALDFSLKVSSDKLPILLGRDESEAQFVVQDPRVSRLHAKVDWRNGVFVLSDLSTYGTWVRFAGSESVIALRRQECVLADSGDIALGASFEDFSVPTIRFQS